MPAAKAVSTVLGGIVLVATCGSALAAAESKWRIFEEGPRVTVTAKVWQTKGETNWNHNASALDPALGDPTSRLTYKDVDSTVLEIKGRVQLPQRFFLELAYGSGDIDEGTLVDEDFLSALGSQTFGATVPGEHTFSSTDSDIDGDGLRYFDLVLGREVFRSEDGQTSVGLFGRYLDWSEEYLARGVVQNVCTVPNSLCLPAGFSGFTNQNVIFNDVDWEVIFIGVDGSHRFGDRVSVSGRLSYSPRAELHNEDIHFLRADLRQDPSFKMDGSGHAYAADLNASYHFTRNLMAQLGFRYWKMKVEDENAGWTSYPVGGGPIRAELNQFESERKGVTLGIAYSWGGGGNPPP